MHQPSGFLSTTGLCPNQSRPFPGRDNDLGFSTEVDGKPAPGKAEMKAYGNDTGRTVLLDSLHNGAAPIRDGTSVG